jgi:hypothetical protein
MAQVAVPIAGAAIGGLLNKGVNKLTGSGPRGAGGIENRAFQGALGQGQRLGQQGNQLVGAGIPAIQQSSDFFGSLLRGDRNRLLEATAPEQQQIAQTFRGAESNIRSSARGGTRDLALANLSRDRAGAQARLLPQLRSGAGSALAQIGLGASQLGTQATGASGQIQGQVGTSLQTGRMQDAAARAQLMQAENAQPGGGLGGFIFEALKGMGGRPPGSKGVESKPPFPGIPGPIGTPTFPPPPGTI